MQRITTENTTVLYFTLTPYFSQYTLINYIGLLDSNIFKYSFDVQFNIEDMMLVAIIRYIEDIESTYQTFILYLK